MIRSFRPGDTGPVVDLWEACGLLRPWNDPYRDIAHKTAVDDDLFLVDETDGVVVGSVMAGYDGHRGWIYYLAVHPDHRGEGVGRELMDVAEKRLWDLGSPKINLQVRTDNLEVIRFYERLGYTADEVMSLGKRYEA